MQAGPDLFSTGRLSQFAVSRLADNVIALTYHRDHRAMSRSLAIIKTRADNPYQRCTCPRHGGKCRGSRWRRCPIALQTGLLALRLAVACLSTASNSYRFSTRFGGKTVQAGLAAMFTGLALMLPVLHLSARPDLWELMGPLFLAGLGNGLVIAPNQDFALGSVPRGQAWHGRRSADHGAADRRGHRHRGDRDRAVRKRRRPQRQRPADAVADVRHRRRPS